MPIKTTAIPLAGTLALLVLLLATPTAGAQTCGPSNVHGDHITAANDFQASGVPCSYALIAATEYTDSAAALNTTLPGTATFRADAYEWSYLWRCRTTELPGHGQLGTSFRCDGRSLNPRFGPARMSFEWWLSNERRCPGEAHTVDAAIFRMVVSRDQACGAARAWIEEASEGIRLDWEPTSSGGLLHFHYLAQGEGTQYECTAARLLPAEGEEGRGQETWDCFQRGRPAATPEYTWVQEARSG
jgi:hypothetical protein